jgi:hypothetical protein
LQQINKHRDELAARVIHRTNRTATMTTETLAHAIAIVMTMMMTIAVAVVELASDNASGKRLCASA